MSRARRYRPSRELEHACRLQLRAPAALEELALDPLPSLRLAALTEEVRGRLELAAIGGAVVHASVDAHEGRQRTAAKLRALRPPAVTAEPMIAVENARQPLTAILGHLDMCLSGEVCGGRRDIEAARRAARDLAGRLDQAVARFRGKSPPGG